MVPAETFMWHTKKFKTISLPNQNASKSPLKVLLELLFHGKNQECRRADILDAFEFGMPSCIYVCPVSNTMVTPAHTINTPSHLFSVTSSFRRYFAPNVPTT